MTFEAFKGFIERPLKAYAYLSDPRISDDEKLKHMPLFERLWAEVDKTMREMPEVELRKANALLERELARIDKNERDMIEQMKRSAV